MPRAACIPYTNADVFRHCDVDYTMAVCKGQFGCKSKPQRPLTVWKASVILEVLQLGDSL
jgi:hypothetical protein